MNMHIFMITEPGIRARASKMLEVILGYEWGGF
jgi:hypothetical protein